MTGRGPRIRHPDQAGLHVRVVLAHGGLVGPGRADLLEGIRDLGSIAAAGRAMGMSYRRAWTLLQAISSDFGAELVVAAPGGASGGRAQVTALGHRVLDIYRRVEAKAAGAVVDELAELQALAAAGRTVSQ